MKNLTLYANLDNINIDNARFYVNDLHDSIKNAIHEATSNCSEEFSKKKLKHGKQWWIGDCTNAHERNRLFFLIWKSVGRPKDGVTYDCYQASRKAYRTVCKQAVKQGHGKKFNE